MSNFGNAPAPRDLFSMSYLAHISGGVVDTTPTNLIEGAVAVNPLDNSIDNNQAILPAGAAAIGVLGVVTDAYGAGGPAEGKPVSVRSAGTVGVNLAASTSVNFGDLLITANAAGDVKPRAAETNVDIVGVALETVAAQPARGRILARLQIQRV